MSGKSQKAGPAARISISLPESLLVNLDAMVEERGYASRSEAISKMISGKLVQHAQRFGKEVLAATITLIYDHARPGLQGRLIRIQHQYLKEIITSQRVNLENNHSLEVILAQAPGERLKRIANELIACKGVKHGHLNVTSTLLPPIY
jgi:CopG family nickel-responsive transcriptional regulator